nr:hypothetical protein [uncultured Celeribacter sp.]
MATAKAERAFRRRVFYIPGYDPIPPRRYRELYRSESQEQAAISGYDIAIAAKSGRRFGWTVEAQIEDTHAQAEIDVLVWADLVQQSMQAGILRTYLILIRTAWIYLRSGALFRLMRLRRGPVLTALYPIAVLTVQLLFALLHVGIFAAIGRVFGPVGLGVGVLLGAAVGMVILRWFKINDGRFYAYYLMHDYGFSARWNGAYPTALKARLAEFREVIAEALREDWDEVLIVGHSSGAHLGVSILADLLRRKQGPDEEGPVLSFLSLGQVVPMVSYLPGASELRRDLVDLSQRSELFWLDVTAPGDPCCFALCDPVRVSGVATEAQRHPLVLSAAFTQTLSAQKQAALKHRFFRLHFQYLCAFDLPGIYDYFRITAGPATLRERFGDCPPSPSRIERAANGFRDLAA